MTMDGRQQVQPAVATDGKRAPSTPHSPSMRVEAPGAQPTLILSSHAGPWCEGVPASHRMT